MTAPTSNESLLACVDHAASLRRDGRMSEAAAVVEAALTRARAKPFDVPFSDRVRLGLALADLYLATGQREHAHSLLLAEALFAEQIECLTRQNGSPEQVRAAATGHYQLRDRATQVALLGQPAPEIEVADWVLGQPTTLAELRGKVVLLEFWARWCRPCLAMFPMLRELHSRYAQRGLTIIALTRYFPGPPGSDPIADRVRQRDAIGQTLADRGLQIAVGIAPDGRLQQTYGATGMPTLALVDRAGIVAPTPQAGDKANLDATVADLVNTPN